MLNSLKISFKLKTTYRVNTLIHSLKQLPLIGKIIPDGVYGSDGLKILGNIISGFIEIFKTFVCKALYVFLMVFCVSNMYPSKVSAFILIFINLSVVGAIFNTYMFNPTNDKFYAMMIMRMDSKKYTLSNYLFMISEVLIGFTPSLILLGLIQNINIFILLLLPLFVVSVKVITNALSIHKYEKKGIVTDENHPLKFGWILGGIFFLLAYGLPIVIKSISTIVIIIFLLSIIFISFFAWKYIFKFNKYYDIYRIILTDKNMDVYNYNNTVAVKDTMKKSIDDKTMYTSQKEGYAYFNDLFVKRHNKILLSSAKKISMAFIALIIAVSAIVILLPNSRTDINKGVIYILPTLTFFMYFLNSGQRIAQAMFINCDSSMLTYGFYREPKVILSLFRERLKSVILINLLPSIIISIGLVLILYLSGGTKNNMDYLLILTSVNSMSIFFSIHHLVLYYLLQPYNENSDIKNMTYQIANMITYWGCYVLLELEIPVNVFGIVMTSFAIIYGIVSLFLVYRLSYKTFKIHS